MRIEACARHQYLMRLQKVEAQENLMIARAAHSQESERTRVEQQTVSKSHAAEMACFQALQHKLVAAKCDDNREQLSDLLEHELVTERAAHVAELQALQQLYSISEMDCAAAKSQIEEMEAKYSAVHVAYASKLSSLEQSQGRLQQECHNAQAQTTQVTAELEGEMAAVQAAHAAEMRSVEQLQLKLELQCKCSIEALRIAGGDERPRIEQMQVEQQHALEEEVQHLRAQVKTQQHTVVNQERKWSSREILQAEQLQLSNEREDNLQVQMAAVQEELTSARAAAETEMSRSQKAVEQQQLNEQQRLHEQQMSDEQKQHLHEQQRLQGKLERALREKEELQRLLKSCEEQTAASGVSLSVTTEMEGFAALRAAHAAELSSIGQLQSGIQTECDEAKAEVTALKDQILALKASHASELSMHEQFHCENVEFEEERDAEWADAVAANVEWEEKLKLAQAEKVALQSRITELLGTQMSSDMAFVVLQDKHDERLAELRGIKTVAFGAVPQLSSPEACIAELHSPGFEESLIRNSREHEFYRILPV